MGRFCPQPAFSEHRPVSFSWLILLVAGLLEVAWAVGLKFTAGFTRPVPTVWTLLTLAGSFVLLERAVRALPIGTAYAVWTGIGVTGTAVLGMVLLDEDRSPARLACIGLILAGIVGLHLLARR